MDYWYGSLEHKKQNTQKAFDITGGRINKKVKKTDQIVLFS